MMNGFGLKYIHRFFNLPFLTLQVSYRHDLKLFMFCIVKHIWSQSGWRNWLIHFQREALMRQLETNRLGMQAVIEELALHEDSEEQNYDT